MRNSEAQPLNSAFNRLLQRSLLLPVIAVSLLVLGVAAIFGGRLAESQQRGVGHSVSFAASNFLLQAANELESMVFEYREGGIPAIVVSMRANLQSHELFDTFYLLDERGVVEVIIPANPRYQGLDMSGQSYFNESDCTKGVNFSSPFTSLRTGQPTVFLTLCTDDNKKLVGEMNLEALQRAIAIDQSGVLFGETIVFVVDQTGRLLAYPDFSLISQQVNINDLPVIQQGLIQDSTVRYWRDDQFMIGTTQKIEPTNWIVVTEVPLVTVYAPYIFAMMALVIILVLIFSIMTRFFFHQIQVKLISPISQLSKGTDALSSGDYSSGENLVDTHATFLEINRLMTNFRNMSQSILSRETLLKESEAQYRRLVEQSPDAILVHSDGKIIFANEAAVILYGAKSIEDLINLPILDLVHPDSRAMARARLQKTKNEDHSVVLPLSEQRHIRINKTFFDAEVVTSTIFFDGQFAAQTVSRDITSRKEKENRLKYQATHDYLTGLPNRFLFEDRLEQALSKAKRQKTFVAVLYIDLDNFKSINDAMGHGAGDLVLQKLSQEIRSALRESDTIARIGGDEFVVLLDDLKEERAAVLVANNILQAFLVTIDVQGRDISLRASMGISIYPRDGSDAQFLMQASDAAMYHAKNEGKNRFMLYSSDMRMESLERISITGHLRQAIRNDEFFVEYQPQIDIKTGKMLGVEALIRWEQPELGLIPPNQFIPFAEESGLIIPIGEWLLKTVLEQGHRWQEIKPLQIAVNLSELQLKQPDLLYVLQGLLDSTKFPPELLELELTENVVFQNISGASEKLFQLKSLGLRLAVDDFGTGYSTLGHLAHFPFDRIKIDQKLAPNIPTDPKDAAIVAGIITISENLDLEVIAEGVETDEQLAFYQSRNCHIFQGWYFSRAVSADTITEYLMNGHNWL